MAYLAVELGQGNDLVVDTNKISIGKSKALAKGLTDIKRKHSPFTKYPLNENESFEEWQKRVLPKLIGPKRDLSRQEGETDDAVYLSRLMEIELEDLDLHFDVLKLIATTFNDIEGNPQGHKVTQETFEDTSLEAAIRFMRDVLGKARIDVLEVFPKRFELVGERTES